MRGWSWRVGSVAGLAVSMSCAACGSSPRQDASEPSGAFNVQVQEVSFPASQRLAARSHLVIRVRNADRRTIPDVSVTITDPHLGTAVQAFGYRIDSPREGQLASTSRPVWIVDRGPAPDGCAYSCREGGPGGAVTADAHTWALGPLAPGRTATFDWTVTAVHAGTHAVHYRVAAGLNGRARAVPAGGAAAEGTLTVTIDGAPAQTYVDDTGRIVTVR